MQAIKHFLSRFRVVRDLDLMIRGPKWRPRESDFQEIPTFALPANDRFQASSAAAERIEGMLSPFSMAIMDMVMSFQETLGARGNMLEIGTFRGKSASVLGSRLRPGESLTLVDIENYLDPASVAPFKGSTDFILSSSSNLKNFAELQRQASQLPTDSY